MNRRDRLIHLGAEIQGMREQFQNLKERIRTAEAEFERLMGNDESDEEEHVSSDPQGRGHETLTQRLIAVLDAQPHRQFTAEEIINEIGDRSKANSIRSTLAREGRSAKSIVKRGHGVYQSAKEQNNRSGTNGASVNLFDHPKGVEIPQA